MKQFLRLFFLLPMVVFAQTNFEKAEQLYKAAKYEQAKPIFELYLKEHPTNLKTIEYLGDIEGHKKSWDKAIFYYKKLKTSSPNEANFYFKYGGALGMKAQSSNKFKALGMISEIRGSFEKAIALNSQHVEARWALVMMYLQLPAIVGGSEAKALKYANELQKISAVDGFLAKGQIDEHFERYLAAEKNYIKAHEIGKSKITYQALYALYSKKLNNVKKAKEIKQPIS